MQIDTSTIDREKLAAITKAARYVGAQPDKPRNMGSGCYLDPPGYPSYFVQHVYTRTGDEPRKGTTLELFGREIENAEAHNSGARESIFLRVYRPLPFEHERVQLWVKNVMQHFARCFIDDAETDTQKRMKIAPMPYYELPSRCEFGRYPFNDDVRFSETHRDEMKAECDRRNVDIDAERKRLTDERAKLATVDNHAGVRKIRQWYPDFTPTLDECLHPEQLFQQDWWERFAERPSEADCIGHLGTPHGTLDNCRMCGRENLQTAGAK